METVDPVPSDADELLSLYREYGWWEDRDPDDVASALANTDVAIGLRDGDDPVASARVVTDFCPGRHRLHLLRARVRRQSSPRTGGVKDSGGSCSKPSSATSDWAG